MLACVAAEQRSLAFPLPRRTVAASSRAGRRPLPAKDTAMTATATAGYTDDQLDDTTGARVVDMWHDTHLSAIFREPSGDS
jgi:hypothetical protein